MPGSDRVAGRQVPHPSVEDRAVQVPQLFADRGLHRAPSVPDLLSAAAAELMNLRVLHVDKDFDAIAGVTGQSVERLSTCAGPRRYDGGVGGPPEPGRSLALDGSEC